jgi:hypothetical protein
MPLKGQFDKQEDAPEYLREHLVEKDGKWVVDWIVDGYVPKETLNEFRNNNRTLNREKEKLLKDLELTQAQLMGIETKYKDIDPDEYKALKEAPTDLQRQLAESEARLKTSLEKTYGERFAQLEAAKKESEQKLQMEKIKSEVARVAPSLGVRSTSMRNLQRDAVETFGIIDDQPVPLLKGEPRYSEKSPSRFMDVAEWIATQVTENPDYFEPSSGGGASGGLGGASRNGRHVIPASDQKAFLANVERIAKGEVEVDMSV